MRKHSISIQIIAYLIFAVTTIFFTLICDSETTRKLEMNVYEAKAIEKYAQEPQTISEMETEIADTTTNAVEVVFSDEPKLIDCKWGNFSISEEEYKLICTTVFCEAGNQDFQTQVMVCLTILNRFVDNSGNFADTISGVIYQQGAYAVTKWTDFEKRGWTEQVEQAVKYALEVNEHPTDMFYFRTLHYHTFGQSYMQSDDLWFSTEGRHT